MSERPSDVTPEEWAKYHEMRNEAVAYGIWGLQRLSCAPDEEVFWDCLRSVLQITFQAGIHAAVGKPYPWDEEPDS